jgi:hypothetical protein
MRWEVGSEVVGRGEVELRDVRNCQSMRWEVGSKVGLRVVKRAAAQQPPPPPSTHPLGSDGVFPVCTWT